MDTGRRVYVWLVSLNNKKGNQIFCLMFIQFSLHDTSVLFDV